MSIYSRDDERNIRVERLVRDWNKSGLITDEQRDRLLPDLRVDLRRTNLWLRITLFVFAYVIVSAAFGLIAVNLDTNGSSTRWVAAIAAIASFFAAQWSITQYRLYRFGIEEAFAVSAVSFLMIAGATLFFRNFETLYAFAAGAIASFVVFRRFGFVYAGVAAIAFATFFIFDLEQSDTFRRLFAAILLLTAFFFSRERRQDHDSDFPGDTYAILETVAWGALYFVTNLKITMWFSLPDEVRVFYWSTYVLTWFLPTAGLWMAIRDRHRWMLDLNIVMLIVTLLTNKLYLGAAQKPWDPILFGVMLIVVSLGLRRWIANGPNGSRKGFVAHRLLESEKAKLSLAGYATVFAPGAPPPTAKEPAVAPTPAATEPPPADFGGGRSGGAGTSGSF
jgi:hypothetical protein